MKRYPVTILFAASSAIVLASPSINDLSTFGGYATALDGWGSGSSSQEGDNLENSMVVAGHHNSNWNYFTLGSATATSSFSDSVVTAQSHAYGQLGVLKLAGTASGANSTFRYGGASGGWADTLTINKAGLAGTTGKINFSIGVDGLLSASGPTGDSDLKIQAYKNSSPGSVVEYNLTSSSATVTQNIGTTANFSVSFTYGTAFRLGVFASAVAGSRSEFFVPGVSSSAIDFSNTLTWNGVTSILDSSNNSVSGYSITSASGKNWINPVPEPSTFGAVGFGLLVLGRRRMRGAKFSFLV